MSNDFTEKELSKLDNKLAGADNNVIAFFENGLNAGRTISGPAFMRLIKTVELTAPRNRLLKAAQKKLHGFEPPHFVELVKLVMSQKPNKDLVLNEYSRLIHDAKVAEELAHILTPEEKNIVKCGIVKLG